MPRTRSLAWSELKIGVLTIIAVAIAVLTIFLLTGSRGFFWQRYSLKTQFVSVAGLKAGSPVRVAGVEVGSVRSVDLVGDKVDVTIEVNKDMRQRITDRSTATLGSVSLLGESAVDITPASSGTPIPEWGYIPERVQRGMLSTMAPEASEGIEQITKLVTDVRQGKGTVGKLMTDEQLYNEMQKFVASANEVTTTIRKGRGSVGRLLNDPKAAEALEGSLSNLETMTQRINAGQGSLGKLLKDDEFAKSLTAATNNFQALTDRMNKGEGTVGKLMTDDAMFKKMNALTDRLDLLVTRVNDGQGTVGLLLKDKQLYENMNGAVADFRQLLAEIRKDPKKYLNVKVSIF
jgi:phospholipid/cholesterol/gamma-HCH transport system substrate-binding protein